METAKSLLIMYFRYRNNGFMRCSILLAVSFAISASAQTQPASQEDINRALELLRKTPAVAPPPAAQPGVPIKITAAPSNAAPSLAPARPLVLPPPSSSLTGDMERRARELLQTTKVDVRAETATPAQEVLERANAREELRKQAIQETRRGLPKTAANTQPGTLAEEQQRKAQEEIDRQKNLERIEMEVQRARLARQQKAAEVQTAAKTNVPASIVAATVTNAPAVAATAAVTNAPAVEAGPLTSDQEAKARALLNEMLAQPVTKPTPAPAAPAPAVAKSAPAPKPAPVAPTPAPAPVQASKPAPVPPAKPIVAAPEPRPVVVQQTPPPAVAPAPVVTPHPTPAPAPVAPPVATAQPVQRTAPAFRGLAPDMEQRARDILNKVMENTKGASLPVLATQPPKPAPVIPAPQTQPEPAAAAATTPVRGPDAPATSTVVIPSQPAIPMPQDQEAKARALLEQMTATTKPATTTPAPVTTPSPAPTPVVVAPATQPSQPAPVVTRAPGTTPAQPEVVSTLVPDLEAKARALLNQTLATVPTTPAAPSKTETKLAPEMDRRAQEDARRQARLKAEIEEETRREIARMEEESQARAREMAKRRLEEEKRGTRRGTSEVAAKPVVKPVVAAVRTTPEPADTKPVAVKAVEKRRAKSDANSKAPAVVDESWKDGSKSREDRLASLLEAYRKDQISAQQYHSERAKILAAQ